MDAGPGGVEIDAALIRRAGVLWMLMMMAETVHGVLRQLFLAPRLGDLPARQLGVIVGCFIIVVVAWCTAKWLRAATRSQQVLVGALWVSLTLIFEVALGRILGMGWPRIVSDYNPLDGGFMLAGLAFMFFTPMMVAGRLR